MSRHVDTAECNIPMAGVRGRRLDAEITRNVAAQRREAAAESKAARADFRSTKAEAKRLHAELAESIIEAHAAKFGARELRKTLREMVGRSPERFVRLATKFQSERPV